MRDVSIADELGMFDESPAYEFELEMVQISKEMKKLIRGEVI